MTTGPLHGRRIMVVEDEYLLADDLNDALVTAGACVLGPVPSVEQAMEMIARESEIDAAVLDVNLRGEMIFSVADALQLRGVPFVFATGYGGEIIPERYEGIAHAEKPLNAKDIAGLLGSLPLDDPEDDGDVALDDDDDVADELAEPTPADLLDDEIIEIDVPVVADAPQVPKGYVAEPDEE